MPTSRILLYLAFILLFQSLFLSPISSAIIDDGDDDLEGLEELLRIDEEEEKRGSAQGKPSDTEVVSKAQKIVLDLRNDNAKRVIDENEMVMLLGYTPWCARSAELMPRFAEAATELRKMESRLVFAKLDAERHAKAASLLGIKGFPTILLFVNGTAQRYTGGLTREEIVIWARKKTGASVIRLSSKDSAEEFLHRHHIFTLGLFERYEGPEYEEFVKAAVTDNEIQFVETNDKSIAVVLFPNIETENKFVGLVKSEPERFEKFEGTFEEGKVLQFVEYNKFPLVTVLSELNSAKVYSSPIKLQVFIFAEVDEFEDIELLLQEVARKYKTKMMFVLVNSAEDNLAKPFLALFGLEPEKPIVAAFDNRVVSKHLMESDLTRSKLEEFCLGLLHRTLPPYFRSEPKPSENGLVEKVVGRTFNASVLESAENVFLEVHAPWCVDCEATSKQIEKLANHFIGVKNLKFARIDASLNEHPKLQVNNFPALLFYTAGDKSNPIKLSKKSSLKEMIHFVKENARLKDDESLSNADQKKDEL
ncbi:protein disulfide isomerase-like 1-5 [Typha angustifolia]|uniref:protein disulfide isomerase-like 1-5 n=1 Tax=Typha angustifolia TaxID=59011 RepID=UPI003C30CF07